MPHKHKFDLAKHSTRRTCATGYRQMVSSRTFPALHTMALATIVLKKNGFREPHWHPNANELTYCIEGKALVTLFHPGNLRERFLLEAGDVMHVPKGTMHHIENIHPGTSRFVLAFDHNNPEDLNLSQSLSSMSPHVLSATFGEEQFPKLRVDDVFIAHMKHPHKIPPSTRSPHKLSLEEIRPQIRTPGGLARTATRKNFPVLEHLALFSLRVAKRGIREPHWHPNATELNLVVKGKARLTILSPGGNADTFELTTNQGSIIPSGYFHHIENIGTGELHMTVFFDHAQPSDIGLSGALSAYEPDVLGSVFSTKPEVFAGLHHFTKDRMIVPGG